MQELIQQKNEEERKIIDILATANFTHAENTHAFTPDYAVTPEEIMEAITTLCRLNKTNVAKFLGQCMGLIGAEEAKAVQRHQENNSANGWAPADQRASSASPNRKQAFVERKGSFGEHFPPPPDAIEDLDGPGIGTEWSCVPDRKGGGALEDSDGMELPDIEPSDHRALVLPNAVETSEGEDVSPAPVRGPQRPSRSQPQLPPLRRPQNADNGNDFKGVLP